MNLLMGGTGDQKLYERYYKAIAECCDYAAAKGMGISIKPHGGLNATGPQCRKTVESVGNKNFGIWYDPGNIFYYSDGKLNPVDDAPSVNGLVDGHVRQGFQDAQERRCDAGHGDGRFRGRPGQAPGGRLQERGPRRRVPRAGRCRRTRWPKPRRRG